MYGRRWDNDKQWSVRERERERERSRESESAKGTRAAVRTGMRAHVGQEGHGVAALAHLAAELAHAALVLLALAVDLLRVLHHVLVDLAQELLEIGRASCRERVLRLV